MRRAPAQAEARSGPEPPDAPGCAVRFLLRRQTFPFQPCQDERIDWVFHPTTISHRREGRDELGGMKDQCGSYCAPSAIQRFRSCFCSGFKHLFGFGRRHLVVRVVGENAANDLALIWLARDDGWLVSFAARWPLQNYPGASSLCARPNPGHGKQNSSPSGSDGYRGCN